MTNLCTLIWCVLMLIVFFKLEHEIYAQRDQLRKAASQTPLSLVSSLQMLSVVYVHVRQLTNSKNGDVFIRRFLGLQSRPLGVP